MSWMKRRSHTTPSPASAPHVQMYNPNQHSNEEWHHQDSSTPTNNWYNQQQQQNPQQKQYPYDPPPQQQQQNYWQQPYNMQTYNQNDGNKFTTTQQQQQQQQQTYNQPIQNFYQNPPEQQQPNLANDQYNQYNYADGPAKPYGQQTQKQDEWGTNWTWGDEDNSNVQSKETINSNQESSVADSFNTEETWNWTVDDSSTSVTSNFTKNESSASISHTSLDSYRTQNFEQNMDEIFPKVGKVAKNDEEKPGRVAQLRKLDHLTPQWSTESQMSQESSDDLLQTSESDKILSRSSTISQSPISGQETAVDGKQIDEKVVVQENFEILSNITEESTVTPPPPILKNHTPPPVIKALEDGKNPYKRLSHKDSRPFQPGNYSMYNQSVNLETLPDNSEHPDNLIPIQTVRKPVLQQIPDNNEMISERNQYLETGRLSDENGALQENVDTLPPPGLRRMVLGQIETNDPTVQNNDEPPPGLSRMVLGQTESSSSLKTNQDPIGFTRMIPGESSSPETLSRQYQAYPDEPRRENYISEGDANPQTRSATIGADTPPSSQSNRSETIGSDLDKKLKDEKRPESLDGQPIASLASGVRDLSIDEERRKESTDSDRDDDRKSEARRYRDDKRYSPDDKHDRRRYNRRYKEDTDDYYSDNKDKDRRRDDYGKFGSLRKEKDKARSRRREYDRRNYERRDYDRKDYDRKDFERKDFDRKDYDRKDFDRKDNREYDRRDVDRGRNRGDYYGRYDDGYDDNQRSRPSSRSDSMHESYRDRQEDGRRQRNRDRDRDRNSRRHRDFNPYMQSYGYDQYNPYYQQYQLYYENLRRTNPQAYAEWYRQYFQQATGGGAPSGTFGTEDRASVHSGRSSANDEMKERYSRPYDATDSSIILDESQPQRSTPAKFCTAHIKASISSGKCVKILPHYPMDGQNAVVEFINMQDLLVNDDELEELVEFPGPLVRGITHKKTVIEYCENKILRASYNVDISDTESYVLMWQLMILLIRQNGMVVGTDIAELLMKDKKETSLRPSSVTSNASSVPNEGTMCSETSNLQSESAGNTPLSGLREEMVTNKFREYLIYGSGKEALEWAMKHGLWGHALFLASKLDKRTYANVMMRFANGLTMNDPLQTLYQLLSGRLPASVTCVADEKWGDWRPHLAMILSNTTSRPELDRKAITTLADTLMTRGSLYAAQFCYLMAEVGFSGYGSDAAKLVLLGSNHNKPYMEFATNEAVHLTEIYEYACSLNDPEFIIMEFQAYKYLVATRLSDRGLLEKALAYLERVSMAITRNPSLAQPGLIDKVCNLADRLKHYDPLGDVDDTSVLETDLDLSRPDTSWLKDLKALQNDYTLGLINGGSGLMLPSDYDLSQQQAYEQQGHEQWQQQPPDVDQTAQWTTQQNYEQVSGEVPGKEQFEEGYQNHYEQDQQQQYWSNHQQQWPESSQTSLDQYPPHPQENQTNTQQQQNDYWNNAQNEEVPRPQISMPNQSTTHYEEGKPRDGDARKPENTAKPSPNKNAQQQASSGWFGGIFSKLALRPKNQMKLPDDKNPSIVWDPEKKKWINLEDDSTEAALELKPPPKMSELMPNINAGILHNQQPPANLPGGGIPNQNVYDAGIGQNVVPQQPYAPIPAVAPTAVQNSGDDPAKSTNQPNMFKLQRNRKLKNSYVDVFNPGGKPTNTMVQPPVLINPVAKGDQHMNFFIPAPVNDPNAPMDFLTPGHVNNDEQRNGPKS